MNTKNILVVDNDLTTLTIIYETLTISGYEVTTATNGQEAMESFKKKHYDLLITNKEIPGMAEIDSLNMLKAAAPKLGVVIISDPGTVDYYLESILQGAYDHLTKPIEPGRLEMSVKAFFDGSVDIKSRKESLSHHFDQINMFLAPHF